MGKFCYNPQIITRRYKLIFESVLKQIENPLVQEKLKHDLDMFVKDIHNVYVSYYMRKSEVKPVFGESNAAVLNVSVKPLITSIERKLRTASRYMNYSKPKPKPKSKNRRLGRPRPMSGGFFGDDTTIIVLISSNDSISHANLFWHGYRFAWEKWAWWQYLLIFPIIDLLFDILMMILQLLAICMSSWYCAIGLFRLVGAIAAMLPAGGGARDAQRGHAIQMLPYQIAVAMAIKGKSVKEVFRFLENFHKPLTTISGLTGLVGSYICKPSEKQVQANMKRFVTDIRSYKYTGSNILVKNLISFMTPPLAITGNSKSHSPNSLSKHTIENQSKAMREDFKYAFAP